MDGAGAERKVLRFLPAVAVVMLIMGGCSGSSASDDAGTTLKLFEHDTQQTQLDVGDKGPSPGDRFVFSSDVFDRQGGTKVGRLGGFCEASSTTPDGGGEDICSCTFTLAKGQLLITGMADHKAMYAGEPVAFSIVGGTGIYREARGDGTAKALNETDYDWTFHIS